MKTPMPALHHLNLLTAQEEVALREIRRERDALEQRRVVWWMLAALLALFSLWTSLNYVGSSGNNDFKPWHAPVFGLFMTVIPGFLVYLAISPLASWVTDRGRAREVHAYLHSIDYPQREHEYNAEKRRLQGQLARTPRGGQDSGGTNKSAQHEWYGDHRELNWRHREQARVLGMDADTYVSNVLEAD